MSDQPVRASSRDVLILLALLGNVVAMVWRAAVVTQAVDDLTAATRSLEATVVRLQQEVNVTAVRTATNEARITILERREHVR